MRVLAIFIWKPERSAAQPMPAIAFAVDARRDGHDPPPPDRDLRGGGDHLGEDRIEGRAGIARGEGPRGARQRVAGLLVAEHRGIQVNRRRRGEHDDAEGDEEIHLHASHRGGRRIAGLLARDGPDDVQEQDEQKRQIGEPRARENVPQLVVLLPAEEG